MIALDGLEQPFRERLDDTSQVEPSRVLEEALVAREQCPTLVRRETKADRELAELDPTLPSFIGQPEQPFLDAEPRGPGTRPALSG